MSYYQKLGHTKRIRFVGLPYGEWCKKHGLLEDERSWKRYYKLSHPYDNTELAPYETDLYCGANMSMLNKDVIKMIKSARICPYCLRPFGQEVYKIVDHIIPRCAGGTDDIDNLVVCCIECNCRKSWHSLLNFAAKYTI
jgi:5-methylcytosine-specific restriction endonuclease McrA